MGRREYESEEEKERDHGDEGGERLEEDEGEGSEGEGSEGDGGSGDEHSDDELPHQRTAAIGSGAVDVGMTRVGSYSEDGDSDSDDAPEEFTLTQARERVSQQRQQEAEARRMVAKAVREVRQKRAGLAVKGDEGEGEAEEEREARRVKEKARKDKRRQELEDRAERRKRRKGEEGGGEGAVGALVGKETTGGAGEGEAGAAREGDWGEVGAGDLLPADVIAAVTRRQHTRFTEQQQERALKSASAKQRPGKGSGRARGGTASAVIGRRSDGAIVLQGGTKAPAGEEAARAIMRAAQSFQHGLLFGRRQRSLAALGFVDGKALNVAGQWRAGSHLAQADADMVRAVERRSGGVKKGKGRGRGGSSGGRR
ncbi:hypothetical protein CLOM_g7935 [Closterium sp. NIES-68]|nr:hypothetical protein CLOM_g7935 [Closterium sp. NIES-68]GJP74717.1 hypothetical protein CLOP_g5260 [Closterium sp. NIES-67]